jgi:Flp pilus assembly protein TadG
MYNLLRCRRGSTALPTVIALFPLIGVFALGVEGGSWYITKEHAQTAADAAAVAGAWRLAWNASDSVSVAQQFAAQNGFCDGCKALGAPQQVSVVSGAGSVQVTVHQQQPLGPLARALFGSSPINIAAQATAVVDTTTAEAPCILATTGSVSFQGSTTVNSPTCGLASNSSDPSGIAFTGNGSSINAPSYTVGGCSETGGTQCSNNVYTSRPQPVPNPFNPPPPAHGLDSAMSSLTTSNFSGGPCGSSLLAYDTNSCYNAGFSFKANNSYNLSGTYFFNGPVTIGGGTTITGTATLVLFGTATLTISGGPTIQLTAEKNPQVPPALSSVQSLMTDLLIYDPEPYSKKGINVSGNSNSYFNGIVYVPNTPVTYTGNTSLTAPSSACYEVIAYAVTFSGNSNIDNTQCVKDKAGILPVTFVRLVPP